MNVMKQAVLSALTLIMVTALLLYSQAPQIQATRSTAADPTYTNNSYNPFSTDLSGRLRTITTLASGGTATANQGTANTAANRWPVYITDGTNTLPTGDAAARRIFVQITDATNNQQIDPCQSETPSYFNISTTANAQLITGVSAKRVYLCAFNVAVAAATNVALVAGTGSVCATNTVAVPGASGGATAATGWNFSANGGIALGDGMSSFAQTTVNADNVCIFLSAANQTSGGGKYVVR